MKGKKESRKAIAYLRTSSAANVGNDKDSDKRQREAIAIFARRSGYDVVAEYYDAAVSGADAISDRPGFAALLKHIAGNGVRTILVETASRFARDLIVQETGYRKLRDAGIAIVAADCPEAFLDDTPTATMVRQILGAVSQFDKAMLVAKLRGARERKRREGHKVEGRRSYVEQGDRGVEMVAEAKRLARKPLKGNARSLRDISAELAKAGYVASSGKPFAATAVQRMLSQRLPTNAATTAFDQ